MAYRVDKSRRIPLDRNTFDFSDMNEVLEWVDFFEPADAKYTVEKFEQLTGKDFNALYRQDFARDYVPPSDDEIMAEPIPEPSPQFKREVLFYWEEMFYSGPKGRPFMAIPTPSYVDEWNKERAPEAYKLFQQDKTDSHLEGDEIETSSEETITQTVAEIVSAEAERPDTIAVAQRAVIETLVVSQKSPEHHIIEFVAEKQPGTSKAAATTSRIKSTYFEGSPSPRKTRLGSKLDAILHQRQPVEGDEVIELSSLTNTEKQRYVADENFSCVTYLNKMYAVRAPDNKAALRRLQGFTT